jgi:hypothetical protein
VAIVDPLGVADELARMIKGSQAFCWPAGLPQSPSP